MKDAEPGELDFLQGPWPMRGSLYRYMEPEYATPYVDGGSIRIARAASYLASETRGIMTPDEVKHRVSRGLPSGITGEMLANGFGLVQVENSTINGQFVSSASEHNWGRNHMVLCLSNSASKMVRDILEKPLNVVVFRIVQPDLLIQCISERLGSDPIFGEVKYTDAPDRGAFTKGLDSSRQREVRFAWDYPGKEDALFVEIPSGIGEVVDLDTFEELLPPRIIKTGGISLFDYCSQGEGVAKISAMMTGDDDWLAESE